MWLSGFGCRETHKSLQLWSTASEPNAEDVRRPDRDQRRADGRRRRPQAVIQLMRDVLRHRDVRWRNSSSALDRIAGRGKDVEILDPSQKLIPFPTLTVNRPYSRNLGRPACLRRSPPPPGRGHEDQGRLDNFPPDGVLVGTTDVTARSPPTRK